MGRFAAHHGFDYLPTTSGATAEFEAVEVEQQVPPLRSGRDDNSVWVPTHLNRQIGCFRNRTADPSTALRSGRDDKSVWVPTHLNRQIGCFRNRTADPSTALRSGRDDNSVWVPTHLNRQIGCFRNRTADPSTALRSGRDDNSVDMAGVVIDLSFRPERSVAEGSAVLPRYSRDSGCRPKPFSPAAFFSFHFFTQASQLAPAARSLPVKASVLRSSL